MPRSNELCIVSFTLRNRSHMAFPAASKTAANALYRVFEKYGDALGIAGRGIKTERLAIADNALRRDSGRAETRDWTAAVMAGETTLGLAQWAESAS